MATPGFGDLHSPRPPDADPELRTIIDKLANFVARNGPEFEQMTMEKQRDNPKFFFLFGGELNVYYKWKVATEQAALHSQSSTPLMSQSQTQSLMNSSQYAQPSYQQHQPLMAPPPSGAPPPPWAQKPPPTSLFARLEQTRLQEQSSLQQFGHTDPLEVEFTSVVSPVMDSCTKEAISAGKAWIFNHSRTREECNQVASLIVRKTLTSTGVGFTHKLHIIYLINDVIHHCLRKGAQELKQAVEDVIVQIFYNVHINDPDKADSLMKVLKIWEAQKYFSDPTLQQIRTVLTEDIKAHSNSSQPGAMASDQGLSGSGLVLPPWQQQQQPLMPPPQLLPPSILPQPGVYNQSLPPPMPLGPLPPLGPPHSQGLQLPSQPLMQSAPPISVQPVTPQQAPVATPSVQQPLPPWQQQQQQQQPLPPVPWQQQQQQQQGTYDHALPSSKSGEANHYFEAFNAPAIPPPPWTSNMSQQPLPSPQQQQLPPSQQPLISPWQPSSQPRPLFAPDDPIMLKPRQGGDVHREHEVQGEGGSEPLMAFKESSRPPEGMRTFGDGRAMDLIRPFGEGIRPYGEGRPPPVEGLMPYGDGRGPEGMRPYGDGRPLPEGMRPYDDGRRPPYGDWSSEEMGPYGGDGRPPEEHYDEREPYGDGRPYDDDDGRRSYREEGMQRYEEDWGPEEMVRPYGGDPQGDPMQPYDDRDHSGGNMDLPHGDPRLEPGEKQIFDYQHQSHPDPFRGRRDGREVFDYNHRPPPNNWDLPPPPPHMGPPPPFCDPHWLPPLHAPDCPPPAMPPDMPPPIPYFDLPAGVMAMLVPLHEHSYQSLHPGDVRLPPPQPPSDRLMKAVEEFYDPPSDDKPRNEEGWEARALLDFFNAKLRAKEAFESRFRAAAAMPRRPVQSQRSHRTHSKSRSRSRSRSRSYSDSDSGGSRSRSRSYSRSRSRSRSHSRKRNHSSRSPSSSSSRSKSRSPKRKRSRRKSRSRSRSPFIPTVDLPVKKAPDGSSQPLPVENAEQKLGEDNVGHQLLKKMGWEGTGLGTKQQGIQEPIKGGEVRDKQNKYKGIGANMNDPFEMYRKTKSYTFNRRPTGTENV